MSGKNINTRLAALEKAGRKGKSDKIKVTIFRATADYRTNKKAVMKAGNPERIIFVDNDEMDYKKG